MMGAMRLADGTWVRSLVRYEDTLHVLVSLRRVDGTIILCRSHDERGQ